MPEINLSTVRPDFNDISQGLQLELFNRESWTDILPTSTGQTLVEFAAAVGAYSQFAIESAFQEVFPESAKNADSLYASAAYLGVRINRKRSASVVVSLTSLVPGTIPILSQFLGAGTFWYNKEAIVVGPTPVSAVLYQGEVITTDVAGTGTDFQAFVSQQNNFVVEDTTVFVRVNNVNQPVITEGLWTKSGSQPGVQNLTLSDGRMNLLFGNALFGTRPALNAIVSITYVITLGANANNLSTLNQPVTLNNNSAVSGIFVDQVSGGGEQANPTIYKNVTPALFGAFNSSVTAAQYKKLPLQYPGVIDAQTFAQREINPRALSLMNTVKVSLLTSSVWTDAQWEAFKTFFERNSMYSTNIYRRDPVRRDLTVTADVYCANFSNLPQLKVDIEAALDALFAPRQGVIGKNIFRSDIYEVIQNVSENIKYILLTEPTTDVLVALENVKSPRLRSVGAGGSLVAGPYDYAVSAITPLGGETVPVNFSRIQHTAGQLVEIAWDPIPGAVAYRVYGRTNPTNLGLIVETAGNVTVTYDSGPATSVGYAPPVDTTISPSYVSLLSKSIRMFYSDRED